MAINIIVGNLLNVACDAIVNPANVSLLPMNELCAAIHKSAGPELDEACSVLDKHQETEAVITSAFNLTNCQHIIHACGSLPYNDSFLDNEKLEKTYANIFKIAHSNKLKSIAIPCDINRNLSFVFERVIKIALDASVRHGLTIYFVCSTMNNFFSALSLAEKIPKPLEQEVTGFEARLRRAYAHSKLYADTQRTEPRFSSKSSRMHPNPTFYKYYWTIFHEGCAENGDFAAIKYCTSDAMTIIKALKANKKGYILHNWHSPRNGNKLPFDFSNIRWKGVEMAPSFEDDSDPIWEGHK